MNKEKLKNNLKKIFEISLPFLEKMTEEKIVPALTKKSYGILSKNSQKIIEKLEMLLEKIKTTENIEKRKAHLIGFKLGLDIIGSIGKELTIAYEQLSNELAEIESSIK